MGIHGAEESGAAVSETNSQSIKSDRISESTIARIAGNLMSGDPGRWCRGQFTNEALDLERRQAVDDAVKTARLIAEVVQATAPPPQPEVTRSLTKADALVLATRVWNYRGDRGLVSVTSRPGGSWLVNVAGDPLQHLINAAGRVGCHAHCAQKALDAGVEVS